MQANANRARLFQRPLFAGIFILCAGLGMSGTECPPADNNNNSNTNGDTGLTGKFVGSERCSQCHSSVHATWTNTLHATALETLEAIGQDKNADCIGCHTVGFGEEGGFVDRATTNALAGVGCESCHGPGKDHVENVQDESLRPPKSIAASVCGQCHTGSHHPTIDEWATSGHAMVTESVAPRFEAGTSLNSCGRCHSGDFFYMAILNTETVEDNFLEGVAREDMNGITCAVCHNPHAQTGNAATPEEGRDYQLRFPQIANPTPTNTISSATDAARFNLCGQCHISRGRTWTDTSRGPHHSVQSNVYVGEMPMPESDEPTVPLVPSRISVHSLAAEQCSTCHLYRQDFNSDQAPAISGHTFAVNTGGCATSGCHPNADQASVALTTLQAEIEGDLAAIAMRLGNISTWGYTSEGGPDAMGQAALSDNIKKIRFLYSYVLADGSLGVHNPDYIRSIVAECESLLDDEGL